MFFFPFLFILFASAIHSTVGLLKLSKCCSQDQLVILLTATKFACVDHNTFDKVDFSLIYITNDEGTTAKEVNYSSTFDVTANAFIDPSFLENAVAAISIPGIGPFYMTENAVFHINLPDGSLRKIEHPNFCVDFFRSSSKKITYWTYWFTNWSLNDPGSNQAQMVKDNFLTTAMFVSCGFLMLVLITYGLLPELLNMCGCILMAYIASLLAAFLHLAIIRVEIHTPNVCYNLTLTVYYSLLASFCWMTVMSYDIWWTFRGYAKSRPIHRRGKIFKYAMYSIYAWGVPLAMTVFLACIDEANLQPNFIKPNLRKGDCFLDGPERFRYLYIPILILIGANWMFYFMTAFNIWRLSRGTAVLDSAAAGTPAAHRTHRHRFLVYLKLSVVMGLNWVLEVASYLVPDFKLWYITDAYNFLIGVFIFIIFVCKKKIFKKLLKLFLKKIKKSQVPSNSRSNNTSTSDSQDTQPLKVCTNPHGPGHVVNNF